MDYRDRRVDPSSPREPRYGVRWVRLITDLPVDLTDLRVVQLSPAGSLRSVAGPIIFSVFDWRRQRTSLGDLVSTAAHPPRRNHTPHARKAHA